MLLDIINKLIKPITIIACISLVMTWAFGIENQLITERAVNGFTIKVVDFRQYLDNINRAWNTTALNFDTILIPRSWVDIQGNITQSQFWEDLGNNLAFLFDCLYFPINFILYIDRWLCWILNLALALIGWNVQPSAYDPITQEPTAYYSQLVQILNWCKINLFIPYI